MNRILLFFPLWVSLFPETIQDKFCLLFRIILIAGFLYLVIKYRRDYLNHIVTDHTYWFYLFGITLSFIFAQNQGLGTNRLYNLVLDSFLIYFSLALLVRLYKKSIARAFGLLSIVVAFIGFLELIYHKNILYTNFVYNPFYYRYLERFRMMSTQLHPSVLGTYFMSVLPFSYYLITYDKKLFKFLGYISSVIIWGGLILTFARGAIIGAVISLGIFLGEKRYRKCFLWFSGVIIIFIVLFTVAINRFYTRHKNFMDIWTKRASISYRLERFPTAFKMLKNHPFVGVGLENFRFLFDRYHRYPNIPYEFKIPDNMYLMILTETGLIGFIAFIIFLVNLFRKSVKSINVLTDEERGFLRLCICGLVGLFFNMFTYDLLYWNMPFYFFWMYAGIIKAYSSRYHGNHGCKPVEEVEFCSAKRTQ